jgi:chromatin remodeling complex protein RSC6
MQHCFTNLLSQLLIDGESQKELEGGMDDIDKVFKKKKSGSKSSSKKADEETTEDHSAPDMKNTPKDLLNVLDAIDATNKSKSKKKRSKDKDSDEKKQKKKRKFEA